MARQRMVTRTVNETVVSVMYVNVETAEVGYTDYKLAGTFETNEDALKYIKKNYEDSTIKYVNVISRVEQETLYGMLEAEFIALAKVLPPRTNNENTEG